MRALLLLAVLAGARACATFGNYQALSTASLALYNLTNPCTLTCNAGFYGDFCQAAPAAPPPGPWNQVGYFVAGAPLVRQISIGLAQYAQVAFLPGGGLVALASPHVVGQSQLVQIPLGSQAATPLLTPASGWSLDALVVRNGTVYVARTSNLGKYDVLAVGGASVMALSSPAVFLEVFGDKGTLTVFYIDTKYNLYACYPTKCVIWAQNNLFYGLFCGLSCPATVYVAKSNTIQAYTGTGSTQLLADAQMLCLNGDRDLNVLLFRSLTGLKQVDLTGGVVSTLLNQSSTALCSLGVSASYSAVLLVQAGQATLLEALEEWCGYGSTSPAIYATSPAQCTPCQAAPADGYLVGGSATCEWQCNDGYAASGTLCLAPEPPPCPAYFTAAGGVCAPSLQPWAPPGYYAGQAVVGAVQAWPTFNPFPITPLFTANGSTTLAVYQSVFYTLAGKAWTSLTLSLKSSVCSTTVNTYTLLQAQGGVLWAGFYNPSAGWCLWSLALSGNLLSQTMAWSTGAQVCAVAQGQAVYVIFCGTHFVAQVSGAPVAGGFWQGYADGPLLEAQFSSPSALVAYGSTLLVADTGNCLIRQVDVLRGVVSTLAGTPGLCQRLDGAPGGAASPINLTYSAYGDFFLFVDQSPGLMVRQLHAPTGTVQSITNVSLGGQGGLVLGYPYSVVAGQGVQYVNITAAATQCPAGYVSLVGGGCTPCGYGTYSSQGLCVACSSPACQGVGQAFSPCQSNRDAYCSNCTNKPPGATVYTGPAVGGACPWSYTPPCPAGYYKSGALCLPCPQWSNSSAGATSLSQCACMAGGSGVDGNCTIPSPFRTPGVCGPLSTCPAYVQPAFPFPLLASCQHNTDSPSHVCPCLAGQWIEQILPKNCSWCPDGLYSTAGWSCANCPHFMQPSLDQSSCVCAAGSWDAKVSSTPQCMCGPGRQVGWATGCTACPNNTFNPAPVPMANGSATCQPCPAGAFAPQGASACVECAPGQYRGQGDAACVDCPAGQYAPDASVAACVACATNCAGLQESACPTEAGLLICAPCPPLRANAAWSGLNCASSCLAGYYEDDTQACVGCTRFNQSTCGPGYYVVPCAAYADAACAVCSNASMPASYAQWGAACAWECEAGYTAVQTPLPAGVAPLWQCVKAAWSLWDLFTV